MLTFFDLATDGSGGEVKAPGSGEAEGSAGGRFERKDVWDMRWSTVQPLLSVLQTNAPSHAPLRSTRTPSLP